MNRRNAILFLALAAAVVAAGAGAAKPKPEQAPPDFFPLRVGDSWTYRNTSDNSEYGFKVLAEEPPTGGAPRYQVEMRAGVIVHKSFSKEDGWVVLWEDRYVEHEGLQMKYEPPKKYLQNPLKPGFKWTWQGKDSTQTDFTEKNDVVGFETVTVPAGKFRAMKLVSEVSGGNAVMTKTYWYADGVGLVKTTTVGGAITYGSELVDYSFKKK
jgi:hypothetical protein